MDNATLGIFFGLLALLGGGISNALVKTPSQQEGVHRTVFYRNLFIVILLGILVLFTLDQAHFSLGYILLTIGLGIFGYIPMYFYFKATTVGKIGVISPVSSANTLIAVIIAITFFHEKLSNYQYLAITIILLGIGIISLNIKEFKASHIFKIESGVPYALVAALGWGIWMALIKIPIDNLGPYFASFIIELTIMLVALFFVFKSGEKLALKNKTSLSYLIPISLSLMIWEIGYYMGLQVANVSIIVALSSASPIVVAIFGRFFYKEKLSLKQYLAIGLIILGIILISLK